MKALLVASVLALAVQAANGSPSDAPRSISPVADNAVYVVVHVDIEPDKLHDALPLLRSLLTQAKHDPAVAHVEVLQQSDAENHFTLIEAMPSQQAYEAFVARTYVKSLRAGLQPLLGAPFDERLHHALVLQ